MIELQNIAFSYDNRPLLCNVNMVVHDCDFVGIVGSNGSGKTTLVRLILRLLKPTSGKILFSKNGKEVASLSMGYVPQCSQIDRYFPISVREVVRMGLIEGKHICSYIFNRQEEAVSRAVSRMNISAIADKPISMLSGGELQRTMLARAIVSHPDVLVLDEPSTYLDAASGDNLYALLQELNKECSIILVGHDVENIKKNAKQVISLDGAANSDYL